MNKKIWFLGVIVLFFVFAKPAFAHQPNYVDKQVSIIDNEPEISKAYYGELSGTPAVYTLVSKNNFSLYVNILSPDIPGAQKNYQVTILNSSNEIIGTLNNPVVEWEHWYENFAGDWYWQGQEFKKDFPAGKYKVLVTNTNNTGKYVLAIGEAESFPILQTGHTLSEVYKTKTQFYGKSWYSIFEGIIGKGLLAISSIILIIVALIVWFIRRKFIKAKANLKQ